MTGIIFASQEEAEPFLQRYERGRFQHLAEGEPGHDQHVLVLLTGTGKIKATLRTERLLQRFSPERLLVGGTCTALNDELELGGLAAASQVLEGDRIKLAAPSYPRLPLETPFEELPTGDLVTQDHLITGEEEQSYWQRIADMSDATGYAVAFVAGTHGVPCHIVKAVTGHPNEEDEDLQATRQNAYETLADFLLEKVEAFREEE